MKTQKILLLSIVLALISYLVIIFGAQPSKAQPPFYPQGKPMLRMDGQHACWQSPDLALTKEQTKTLEAFQHAYMAEATPLRRELIPLEFELRYLIRNPNVQSKILLDLQKKISGLQAKLEILSLSYQIKTRSIFTREQLERLSGDCLLGMGTGFEMGMGIGRGLRKRFP